MLTRAEFSDATPTNYFGYDVDSVRVEKVDSGGRKQYVRSGLNDLVERSGDTVNRVFIHGMKPLPGVGSLLHVEEGASDLAYHLGPLGNARQLTDSGENVNTDLEFDAFGTRPPGEGDAHTGRGFVSKELDVDTDLWAFPARMYDAATGRFLSRDPLSEALASSQRSVPQPHVYVYADQSPPNLIDPTGEAPIGRFELDYWAAYDEFILSEHAGGRRVAVFKTEADVYDWLQRYYAARTIHRAVQRARTEGFVSGGLADPVQQPYNRMDSEARLPQGSTYEDRMRWLRDKFHVDDVIADASRKFWIPEEVIRSIQWLEHPKRRAYFGELTDAMVDDIWPLVTTIGSVQMSVGTAMQMERRFPVELGSHTPEELLTILRTPRALSYLAAFLKANRQSSRADPKASSYNWTARAWGRIGWLYNGSNKPYSAYGAQVEGYLRRAGFR